MAGITPMQEEVMHRAQEVSRLMNNPAVQKVFEDIKRINLEEWRRTARTVEDREGHWMLDRAITTIEDLLRAVVDNGEVTKVNVERMLARHPELDPNAGDD